MIQDFSSLPLDTDATVRCAYNHDGVWYVQVVEEDTYENRQAFLEYYAFYDDSFKYTIYPPEEVLTAEECADVVWLDGNNLEKLLRVGMTATHFLMQAEKAESFPVAGLLERLNYHLMEFQFLAEVMYEYLSFSAVNKKLKFESKFELVGPGGILRFLVTDKKRLGEYMMEGVYNDSNRVYMTTKFSYSYDMILVDMDSMWEMGVPVFQVTETMYLTPYIPVGCIRKLEKLIKE